MAIDTEAIKKHIKGILAALGDNPEREGLKDTPSRVAHMFEEVFEGMNYSNDEIARMFDKTFAADLEIGQSTDDLIIVKDIDVFSYCEHHLALMYDMKVTVAYVPNNKVIGLSKIARIADMVSKRLQLQERIGSDIAEIIQEVTKSQDVAVQIDACHSCMSCRGIRKTSAKTRTSTLRGRFQTDAALQMRLK
ncbi:GTP cyclohydrolase I FolE [Sinanaerobacter sp. ZZT-01]|uniref:GTP cyclohydrolase I FolE n=1 Tax=Sinanaerobacter sp. ZZT-01 TaxID=3111540 RepID=UPI002D769F78|nr:GTP cyclohydrolase I FolE [Sinanaerobacter sp. ZZT-01]WRR92965.1 GTP cyclohydrolase I FolE [Sinanaerobacter sp. ZZT-01]